MTPADLDELKAMAAAVSETPLKDSAKGDGHYVTDDDSRCLLYTGDYEGDADDDFVAFAIAAHAAIPKMVEEVERLREENEKLLARAADVVRVASRDSDGLDGPLRWCIEDLEDALPKPVKP